MPDKDSTTQWELDTTGLVCPEPVMLLHSKVGDMQPGDLVRILATDPSTLRDIPQFCRFLGHELVSSAEQGDCYIFIVQKGGKRG